MQIHVRYFAVFRERLKCEGELVELPEGSDVRAALRLLEARHPPVLALRGRFRVAVNQEMVNESHQLHPGDELVLIPPVAGGSSLARMAPGGRPSLDRVVAAVRGPGMGGIVTFTGMVRDSSNGRQVVRLEYEAYVAMADRVLQALCEEVQEEFPGCRVAVEHATGALQVGDLAVTIAAAAPHRAEAFSACRALIDRLKERAPIWKKEIGPDGAEWVGLGP
jgi:molybdopterin synthase catalytic subunit